LARQEAEMKAAEEARQKAAAMPAEGKASAEDAKVAQSAEALSPRRRKTWQQKN
jgi:translation initiation factor IF-2